MNFRINEYPYISHGRRLRSPVVSGLSQPVNEVREIRSVGVKHDVKADIVQRQMTGRSTHEMPAFLYLIADRIRIIPSRPGPLLARIGVSVGYVA